MVIGRKEVRCVREAENGMVVHDRSRSSMPGLGAHIHGARPTADFVMEPEKVLSGQFST